MEALDALTNQDWEVFTETFAHVSFGWPEGEQARQWAGLIRESITQEAFQAATTLDPQHAEARTGYARVFPYAQAQATRKAKRERAAGKGSRD